MIVHARAAETVLLEQLRVSLAGNSTPGVYTVQLEFVECGTSPKVLPVSSTRPTRSTHSCVSTKKPVAGVVNTVAECATHSRNWGGLQFDRRRIQVRAACPPVTPWRVAAPSTAIRVYRSVPVIRPGGRSFNMQWGFAWKPRQERDAMPTHGERDSAQFRIAWTDAIMKLRLGFTMHGYDVSAYGDDAVHAAIVAEAIATFIPVQTRIRIPAETCSPVRLSGCSMARQQIRWKIHLETLDRWGQSSTDSRRHFKQPHGCGRRCGDR